MTELTAADGHVFGAHEATATDAVAAVVIVQEIFGVNAHIRSVVDRYAALGYHAISPAVFDRVEPGIELGYDGPGVERGIALAGEIADTAMLDIAAAVERVARTGPVAVIGYCFGGSMAWLAANQLPIAAAVGYYGGQIPGLLDRSPQVPTMLHFGEADAGIPLDVVQSVAAAHPEVAVHVYPGADHGFNCDVRASYDAESAVLAQDRSLEFLNANGVVAANARG